MQAAEKNKPYVVEPLRGMSTFTRIKSSKVSKYSVPDYSFGQSDLCSDRQINFQNIPECTKRHGRPKNTYMYVNYTGVQGDFSRPLN